jgi:uncharacterized DUF497 family protein
MEFEWDDAKAEANKSKHGVEFAEAATYLVIHSQLPFTIPITQTTKIGSSRSECQSITGLCWCPIPIGETRSD